jgi:hypothetical protein
MEADINETCDETYTFPIDAFGKALSTWLADATDSLRQTYDTATRTARARRYDNCRLIVHALAALASDGGTHAEILAKIREDNPEYPPGNLSGYLLQLQSVERGEVILHDEPSGRYYFASPMLAAYSRAVARRAVDQKPWGTWDLRSNMFYVTFAKELGNVDTSLVQKYFSYASTAVVTEPKVIKVVEGYQKRGK